MYRASAGLGTEKGIALIKVLPDKVKSPLLTANWENALKRMERKEVTAGGFIQSINSFVGEVVNEYGNIAIEGNPFGTSGVGGRSSGEVIGTCPRCGGKVAESPKAFSCEHTHNKACGFALWKDNKWFASQGKKITKAIAAALVNDGRVFVKDLKSKKTGKTYSATVLLDDNKEGYVNFRLSFEKQGGRK